MSHHVSGVLDSNVVDVRARLRPLSVIVLVAAWCALWGEVSIANIVSGIVVAVGALRLERVVARRGSIQSGALLRLAGLVTVDLVRSTVDVAREVLSSGPWEDETVDIVTAPPAGPIHHLIVVVAVTLTPGTAVVDVDPDTSTWTIHLLRSDRADDVRSHIDRLVTLVNGAFAVPTVPGPKTGMEPDRINPTEVTK